MNSIQTINPATEDLLAEYPLCSDQQLVHKLEQSAEAFRTWREVPLTQRVALIQRLAAVLRETLEDSAQLMTREMGKPITQSRAEVEKCAVGCEFYATEGPGFLSPQPVATDAQKSLVRFDPLGPVLAIMPWNFPFWQVLRFAVPALLAGNVCLLKHASNVTGSALAIEQLFKDAGFPSRAFTTLVAGSSQMPLAIGHPAVRAVTLTGSERAGRAVAAVAGQHLKKCVLELGGSDPFIVLGDVDVKHVALQATKARTLNSGQSCIAAKRFLVEQSIYSEFVDCMTEQMRRLRVGDPLDSQTAVGPLARQDLLDELHAQVEKSICQGARLTTGGMQLEQLGAFYPPTVLADMTPEMTCFREELFGPVAAIMPVADADAAVELANASAYGLGGSIWTQDVERGELLAARIEAGSVFINEITKSDPRVPFGGVKDSGYGRELSHFGLREFVNIKTVWIG